MARGVGGSVITRVHSIHISSVVAVALKVLTKIGTYITIKESQALTCSPSLSVELVQVPAPEQRVGTSSPAKPVVPRGACVPAPRDDVVRFQTCCLLHVHQLATLLIHC